MRRSLSIAILAGLVLSCGAVASSVPRAAMVFPGADWQQGTPESQGVDSTLLNEAANYLRANAPFDGVNELVIIRDGVLIWKGSNIDRRHGIWSCTKSFTSTVLGLLVDEGRTTLDTPVVNYLSSMSTSYPTVTFRHFTTMTSGYFAVGDTFSTHGQSGTPFTPSTPLFTPPGSKYAYWDSAMNQFGNGLTRVAGEPIEQLFKRRIADPIGMKATDWNWGDWGVIDGLVVNGGAGNRGMMEITVRQMARLGHLFLNRGNWNGQPLISASWVDAATRNQVPSSTPLGHATASPINGPGVYGFNWWANGLQSNGARKWPGAPTSTFSASGANNNDMFVIPDWGMVVVRLGLDEFSGFTITDATYSTFLQKIGQAIGAAPPPPPATQSVSSFTLVNADSDADIGPLANGATINLATLPTRNLNVRANTSPSTVGSVRFGYDGNASYRTESAAPYALAGDASGDYNPWTPSLGTHSLTATPYASSGATGTAGSPLAISFTVTDGGGTPPPSAWRIGLSHDGNQHDPDDILAIAMGIAVLGEAGEESRLVHCDYGNHLGDNNPSMAAEMAASAAGAAQRWGVSASVLFDDQTNLTGAVNSIRNAINASSAGDRFVLVCAGPMEVAWRGINASDPGKRPYCTAISHSSWNDTHADTPQMTHRWTDIQSSGVQTIHIKDQNPGLRTALSDWYWLRDSSLEAWRWLYGRNASEIASAGLFDCSDAGMVYFVITGRGDPDANASKIRSLFMDGAGGPSLPAVTSFTLINADTDQPVAGFDPINSGATLNLGTLPTRNLNLRANVTGAIGSVRFGYDGNASYRVENVAPYALAGDASADYNAWTPAVGSHSVTATPFSGSGATGTASPSEAISFSVVDNATSPSTNVAIAGVASSSAGGSSSGGGGSCGLVGAEALLILALLGGRRRQVRSTE